MHGGVGCLGNIVASLMDCVLPAQTRFVLEKSSSNLHASDFGGQASFDGTVSQAIKRSLTGDRTPLRVECLLRLHEVRGCRHSITEFYKPVVGANAKIGDGAFAQVHRYRSVLPMHNGEFEEFAVKFIEWTTAWSGWLRDTAQEELVHREMKMLLVLDNPFIVRVREWFEDYRGMYIVMEVCEGGSFQDLLEQVCEVESREDRHSQYQPRLRRHFREIAYALQYLHSMTPPIAHCDLKPENALLKTRDPTSSVKLIDFGLVSLHNKRESFSKWGQGTQIFMAPEQFLFAEGKFTTHIDIWALGVIFGWVVTALELGSLQHPMLAREEGRGWDPSFQDLYHGYQPFMDVDAELGGRGVQRWNRDLFGDQPKSAYDLADQMLVYPPQARWSARKILDFSEWVRAGNAEDAKNKLVTQESIFMNMRVYPHLSKFEQIMSTLGALWVSENMGNLENVETVSLLSSAFQDFDTDNDGMLDKSELLEAFRRGGGINMRLEDFREELELLFARLRKPALSYTEWLAATMGCTVLGSEEAVNGAFQNLDAQSHGHISRDALVDALGEEEAASLLRKLRKDPQTGAISYEEFNTLAHRAASKRWNITCAGYGDTPQNSRVDSSASSTNSLHSAHSPLDFGMGPAEPRGSPPAPRPPEDPDLDAEAPSRTWTSASHGRRTVHFGSLAPAQPSRSGEQHGARRASV